MSLPSAERWHRIDALFREALDLPSDQRTAYLQQACGDDTELYDAVQRLLAHDTEANALLEGSVSSFAAPLLDDAPPPPDHTGETIGVYRLVRPLGRGGMGTVYLAERADDQFRKQVALKLVKRGMDTDEILGRFRYERQILAALEHPAIARLLDGGMTDDGRPYFVMEYVNGVPIDQYCDANRLSVEARLGLFAQVCQAVQYAHQNLVVHRDLKPSNILVTAEGQVKLLDFGIAKLLDPDAGFTLTAPNTRTGFHLMTPQYASPEQVSGHTITTASDVYALGVILYELLTGQRPYDLDEVRAQAVMKAVLEQEPARPSTAVTKTGQEQSQARAASPEQLQRRLRGDLDTILLKALRKTPERRYASVEAFQEDIRRHLSGLPVTARPDSLGYRVRKFVGRHTVGVALAAGVVLLLIGFSVVLAWQQAQTAQERDRAEAVAAFLQDLFDASDPFLAASERRDTLHVRYFLDRGAARIGELDDQPAVQAHMRGVLGDVYQSLGLYDTAAEQAEAALAAQQVLDDPDALAERYQQLGRIRHAQSEYDEAERLFREALALQSSSDRSVAEARAATLFGLAAVRRDQGAFDEARALLQEALNLRRQLHGTDHLSVADVLEELGRVHQDIGEVVPAESLYQEVLQMRQALLGEEHLTVARSVMNVATTMRQQGRPDEAEPLLLSARDLHERLLGPEHPRTLTTIYELAGVARDKGDYETAVERFQHVIAMDRKVLGEDHHYVGENLMELAITYSRMEDYEAALEAYDQALDNFQRTLPDDHPNITTVLVGTGYTYILMGQPARGEPLVREALRIRSETLGEDSWRTAVARSVVGHALMDQGRYAEAEPYLVDGYETLVRVNGPTSAALRRLVALYTAWDRPDEVAKYQTLGEGE